MECGERLCSVADEALKKMGMTLSSMRQARAITVEVVREKKGGPICANADLSHPQKASRIEHGHRRRGGDRPLSRRQFRRL